MSVPATGHELDDAALADPARRAAVERLLSSGARSEGLDRLTALAATLLGASRAQVSLLADVQHVASIAGAEPPPGPTPLEDSLCTVTARSGGALAISDAGRDARVQDLPPVTSGTVGAYLGVPLVGDGHVLGALCVHDPSPRVWTAEQVGVLSELSRAVVAELELRAVTLEVATAAARLDLALSAADIGSFDWDVPSGALNWDDRMVALFGYERETFVPSIDSFLARLHPEDRAATQQALGDGVRTGEFHRAYRILLPGGEVRWVEARGRLMRGGSPRMLGAAFDATARYEADAARERAYREREQAVVERERAYAEAEAANTRLQLLVDATARLGASLEPAEVLEELASTVVPSLGRWVVVAAPADVAAAVRRRPDPATSHDVSPLVVRHSEPARTADLASLIGRLPLSSADEHGVGAVLRTGVPEWVPAVTAEVLGTFDVDEPTRAALADLQVDRALTVPLVSRGRRLAALIVAEPLTGALDRALLLDLAGRAAVALDNALLYRAERQTGITLQRSLLPRDLPRLPGLELAARYLPGDDGAFVGGDFYQGVVVDQHLVLALGDVMGHGMRSAARMGQLRAITAALALEGHAPGKLLSRLARSTDVLLDVELATLLVARLDPATGDLCVASAGHPPPLVAGRQARYVEVDPGPPLGTFDGEYAEVTTTVRPGETLLLYSDGLVEDRGSPLGAGLERLRTALEGVSGPAAAVADHVLEQTGRRDGADDDIALLVVRRAP